VSHLASVGFQRSEGDAKELISTAVDRATEVVEHADGKTATYRDPSGATLTVHLSDEGDLHCVKPGFEGDSRARWRPVAVTRDPECRFCDFVCAELLEEDEPVYPFVLSVVTIGSDRALIPYGEPGDVRFTGLWENGELWQDEEAFRRAEEAEWGDVEVPEALRDEIPAFRGWASRSLIPVGAFVEPGSMTPHVIAHGIVSSVEERRNELGGATFRLVRLDTLGGVFDVCLAPGSLEREELLAPGAVARATLWLVGRPITLRTEPGPVPALERRSLLRRLFRR
jgi:hypothetical protein